MNDLSLWKCADAYWWHESYNMQFSQNMLLIIDKGLSLYYYKKQKEQY